MYTIFNPFFPASFPFIQSCAGCSGLGRLKSKWVKETEKRGTVHPRKEEMERRKGPRDICRDGYSHNMLEHEDVFEIVSSHSASRREVSLKGTPGMDGILP